MRWGKQNDDLFHEIPKFTSLSNELVSLCLDLIWQSLLKVMQKPKQDGRNQGNRTEMSSTIFFKGNVHWAFFFLVLEGKEWNNY